MNRLQDLYWPPIALALAGALVLVLSGTEPFLVIAVLVAWIGSLWLRRRQAKIEPRAADSGVLSNRMMIDLIEPFGLPILMLDKDRIAGANAAAREALGQHVVGQDARVALRHPEAIALLETPSGTVMVKGLTAPRSIWQVSRVPIDARFSLIELVNRTAEADISRAHTDFVANASHELRTPLASIIGYIETLSDPDAKVDKATSKRFHLIVLREARRLQTLVEDLMALSRIEAEKHDPPRNPIDLAMLASGIALEIAESTSNDSDGAHRVIYAGVEEGLTVAGDRQQLDQLVRNLVDNALKYGDPVKPVVVGVAHEGNEAVLTVRNEGEGIAPEHLPHLTRRFYRTDPGRSRAAGGTGLGLAIVKHIVERHRGRFDITSKLGVGTTVTARFKLTATPALPLAQAAG
ncbi:ATP-binding protein [Novosphingobium sp.]|uniref:sensor histidine kinase n=1 Tax=Novosphingobium sp. TaxID=1874826 RepID=UPI0025E0D4AD|nr:ATP-binding protein [Novosphingobium sp.]